MKRSRWILLFAIITASTLVGAYVFTGTFWGKQEGTINIQGITTSQIQIRQNLSGWFGNLTDVGLIIPIDESVKNLSFGDNKTVEYYLINGDNQHSYNISFFIDDNWFNNVSSPYYGFRYGINLYPYGGMTYFTLYPNTQFGFKFWYSVDSLMYTPPSGTVPVNITVSANKI